MSANDSVSTKVRLNKKLTLLLNKGEQISVDATVKQEVVVLTVDPRCLHSYYSSVFQLAQHLTFVVDLVVLVFLKESSVN